MSMVKLHIWCVFNKQTTNNNKFKEKYNMTENQRTIKVGSLKAGNSVNVVIDKNSMYTVAQVIELAGFAVPESVRTESGLIESTALLPDSCKMIALGISNVKAGYDDYDDYGEDEDEEPRIVSEPVPSNDIPCEFKKCIKVGSLKAGNSRIITIDKRSMYTVAQVIEMAGFAVPESVRTESGLIESTALLPDSCKMIALGISNVKAGNDSDYSLSSIFNANITR